MVYPLELGVSTKVGRARRGQEVGIASQRRLMIRRPRGGRMGRKIGSDRKRMKGKRGERGREI